MNSIEIEGLVKKFNLFTLGPLDLKVPTGCMVGYIGENGAGKSTTLKLILGLLRPDAGTIKIFGQEIHDQSPELKDRIGVVFDDLYLPEQFTINEVNQFCKKLYGRWEQSKFTQYLDHFGLPATQHVKNLSRGMKMKLSLAMALSHHAELLILDEATSGLDPVARDEVLDILLQFMQEEDHSILVSSHILSDLEKIADYIAFIHQGKLLFMDVKDELKEKYGLCSPDDETASTINPEAILGIRRHHFGQEILVERSLVPDGLRMETPSIEDIMVLTIKGGDK